MPVSKKKSDNEPVGEDPCRLRLRGRSETTDEPAETEKKSAREKDLKAGGIIPRVVDTFTHVKDRPEKKSTSAEILNYLRGLVRD